MKACVVLLFLAACGSKHDGPSCADRVATMSAHLAAPRSVDEIRKTASPALRAALDIVAAAGDARATAAAKQLMPMVEPCPPLSKVLGELGSMDAVSKDDYLRTKVPPAIEACQCRTSPEDAGGLFEAILTEWGR